MCRHKTESGRRCPCDTSEARRLRRHNAQAIKRHSDVLDEPTIKPDLNEARQPAPINSMESVKEALHNVDTVKSLLNDPNIEQTVQLSDGTYLQIKDYNLIELDENGNETTRHLNLMEALEIKAEAFTTETGSRITALVDERLGKNTVEFVARDNDEMQKLTDSLDAVSKELNELDYERRANYPTEYGDKGWDVIRTSYRVISDAAEAGDEKAIQMEARRKELSAQVDKQRAELNKIARDGGDATREHLEAVRDETVKILKEIRPLGGDVTVTDNSNKKAVTALRQATTLYPSSWIEASNADTPMRVKLTSRRAHYSGGSFQDSYKMKNKAYLVSKPEGWEPDPHEMNDIGYFDGVDPETGEWTDEDGVRHSYTNQPGTKVWVRKEIEWGGNYNYELGGYTEDKPRGNGWIAAKVKTTRYNSATRTHEDVGLTTRWYRQKKSRERVSSKLQPELTISGIDGQKGKYNGVALHEMAHRIENTPKVGEYITRMEERFLRRRTTDAVTGEREPLKRIYVKSKEFGRADNFVNHYMGKEYKTNERGTNYREVLSTGAEAVFGESFGNLVGNARQKPDTDMRNFIIGLWATA